MRPTHDRTAFIPSEQYESADTPQCEPAGAPSLSAFRMHFPVAVAHGGMAGLRREGIMIVRILSALFLVMGASIASAQAVADIDDIARCQRRFAKEGAKFAQRVIRATLDCTLAISECHVQCDAGVFGPPCDENPPPCCDPDDRTSNVSFDACMLGADADCAKSNAKILIYESQKVKNITTACSVLTPDELCGAQADGLGFATLNAGCQALNPGYTCSLTNLINCVGGPLERQHLDQISMLLHPRASQAIAAAGLHSYFPDLPIARRVREDLPEGKADVWAISGQAGDEIIVRVKTLDDNGNGTSNLHPLMVLLDNDQSTALPDTSVKTAACSVANVCGASCPHLKRTLPFTRTYYAVVKAAGNDACSGGRYKLVVVSPGGSVPVLVGDDVDTPALP